jgi:hypothetical protein
MSSRMLALRVLSRNKVTSWEIMNFIFPVHPLSVGRPARKLPKHSVVMLDSAVLVPKPPPRAAADACLLASFIR